MTIQVLFFLSGVFAVTLGLLHFTFPKRFGYMVALPIDGDALPEFRLLFYRYDMKRTDLRGIIYVMNHCVSYAILCAGVFDLACPRWFGTHAGSIAALGFAGLWFVRASSQLYLGRRKGDWFVLTFFSLLGILHVVPFISWR